MLFIILLSILQIFFEDFCLFSKLPFHLYEKVCLSTIVFDVIFTLEFLCKFIYSIAKHKVSDYFVRCDGFVDLFVSVPMLLFVSLPVLFVTLHVWNVIPDTNSLLKLSITIRSLGFLHTYKFLRILKINRNLNLPTSPMINHHIGKILKTVLVCIIICFCILNFLQDLNLVPNDYNNLIRSEKNIAMSLIKQQEIAPTIFEDVAGISVQPFKDVCGMIYNNKWLYKSPNVDFNNLVREMTFLNKLYNYEVGANGCLYILFSRRSYYETMAFYNMLKLIFLLLIIIITIISYAPHFAMYISKPILSMIATMSQPLNVSKIYINKHYAKA